MEPKKIKKQFIMFILILPDIKNTETFTCPEWAHLINFLQ